MATLTEVSFYTRRIIKYGAVIFFILLITPAVFKGAKKLYLVVRPPAPEAPNFKYGKLPKLYLPDANSSYKPELKLETVNGQLPKFNNVGKVYLVQINKSRLLEIDRIKPKARVLGFVQDPIEQPDGQTFKFTNPANQSELTVNIISNNFHYSLNWQIDQSLYSGFLKSSNDQLLSESKSFLQNLGLLSPDLSDGEAKFAYFQTNSGQLSPVNSVSEANFARVDIFRSQKDKLPFVATGGNKSTVSVLFSSSQDRTKRVVDVSYQYSKTLDDDFGTYPLISVDQAWQLLQQGQGYIATKGEQQVTVRKVWMAYYESSQPQQFLQPVFVFEGDKEFLGYVPAIEAKYTE